MRGNVGGLIEVTYWVHSRATLKHSFGRLHVFLFEKILSIVFATCIHADEDEGVLPLYPGTQTYREYGRLLSLLQSLLANNSYSSFTVAAGLLEASPWLYSPFFPSILEGCPALVNVTVAIFSPPDDDCLLLFPRVHQLLLEAPFLSVTFQKLDSSELRFYLIWFLRHLLCDVTDWRPAQLFLESTIVGIRWGVQQEEKGTIKIRFQSWRFRLVGHPGGHFDCVTLKGRLSFRTWRKSYWESCTLKFIRAASTDGRCKRTTIRHQCDWKVLNTTTNIPKEKRASPLLLVFSVCISLVPLK